VHPIIRAIIIVLFLVLTGSFVYSLVEGVDMLTSVYLTLETVTTVGYGDVSPKTTGGRIVAMGIMVAGVGGALYVFSAVASFLVEGRLRQILGVRKMKKSIESMRDHYLVCGYGQLGKLVVQELEGSHAGFVIIETNRDKATEAREKGHLVVEGDASHQDVLEEAGIARATGLASTISDDAENLYIGITARSIQPGIPVAARSSSDRVRQLFERAGINNVISIDEIGARRLVSSLIRPHIVEFVDHLLRYEEGKPSLRAVRLEENAQMVGRTILESRLRDEYGIVVLAIQRDGQFVPHPGPQETLQANDMLITVGVPEQLERLRCLVEGQPCGDAAAQQQG